MIKANTVISPKLFHVEQIISKNMPDVPRGTILLLFNKTHKSNAVVFKVFFNHINSLYTNFVDKSFKIVPRGTIL